jgi:predicted Zn-dependent peptidase
VGVVGKMAYDAYKSAHQYEGVSKDFLKAAGYDDAAANALSKQDGILSGASGSAQMPFLAKYAQYKHLTPNQLEKWINSLTPNQVKHLSQRLLQTAGDSNGDPNQFTDGPPQTAIISGGGYPAIITLANTVGVFDSYLDYDHVTHP